MIRKNRKRTYVGVEPKTPSENPAELLDTCAQSNFNSNSSKLSKEGQKLSRADLKANPMVAQKPILHVQRINPSGSETDPSSADQDYQTEAIKSPGTAFRSS